MSTSLLAQTLAKMGKLATDLGTVLTNLAAVQTTADNIRGDIANARDNINTATNAARDNVKLHVSTAVGSIASIKSVQRVFGSGTWTSNGDGVGADRILDIPISTVNLAKAFVVPVMPLNSMGDNNGVIAYRLLNASTVRCTCWRPTSSNAEPSAYGFQVVEGY